MKSYRYIFDAGKADFKKAGTSLRTVLWRVFKWVSASVSLSILCYAAIALFYSTDEEERLEKANLAYKEMLPRLSEEAGLLSDEVKYLKIRDNHIYREIFSTDAPSVNPGNVPSDDGLDADLPYDELVRRSSSKFSALMDVAAFVEDDFRTSARLLSEPGTGGCLPSRRPLRDMAYTQTGASIGMRLSPFIKVPVQHNGLDIIAGQGEPVYATASGTVVRAERSPKGQGHVVEIDCGGGYLARFAHLSDIYVTTGQKVRAGDRIASVGMSGRALVPHLHYEVLLDGIPMDPVGYMFAQVGPEEFADMRHMALHTIQSLD